MLSINIAVIAFVWNLLTQNGEIFDFVPGAIQRISINPKINKMLYACSKCVAGQIAFWHSVLTLQNPIDAFLLCVWTVFWAYVLSRLSK